MSRRAYVHAVLLVVAFELFCHPTNAYLGAIAPWRGLIGTMVFAALVAAAAIDLGRVYRVVALVARVAPAVTLTFALYEARDYSVPPMIWLAVQSAMALLLVAVGFSRSLRLVIVVYALLGIFVRAEEFAANANYDKFGDMLPLVDEALARLRAGHSPYAGYEFASGYVPLTYLPITLLAYVPCAALGLDLRWTHVLAQLLIIAAVVRHARRAGASDERMLDVTRLAAWPLVSASTVIWDLGATASVFWAVLAWTLGAAITSQRSARVWLGVALATSPLALPFVLPLAAAWWKDEGRAVALRRTGVALGVGFAICAPFLLWNPSGFIEGTVLWFNVRFPAVWWRTVHAWQPVPGFATWFWRANVAWLLKVLQAGVVLGFAYWVSRRTPSLERFALGAGTFFVAFMLLNPVLWTYFYVPAFVATLMGAACVRD